MLNLNLECGLTYVEPNLVNLKIVGGSIAEEHSWPAHTLVRQDYIGSWILGDVYVTLKFYFSCGGTLINRHTILSAAHCKSTQYFYKYDSNVYVLNIIPNDMYPTFESMFCVHLGLQNLSIGIQNFKVEKNNSGEYIKNKIF